MVQVHHSHPRINDAFILYHVCNYFTLSSIKVASIDENKNSHPKITMTHSQTPYISRIALRTGKKGVCPAEVGALALVFKKSATELKQQKLLKCKQTIQIAIFNV